MSVRWWKWRITGRANRSPSPRRAQHRDHRKEALPGWSGVDSTRMDIPAKSTVSRIRTAKTCRAPITNGRPTKQEAKP
ncbi:hypothetical protein ACNKHO_19025 [Shigella flexneri]